MSEFNSALITQIDDYLDGNLSKEKLESFEKTVAQDSTLQDFIQEQRIIRSGINRNEQTELKLKLDDFHAELYESEKPQAKVFKLFSIRNIAIAASVLMLAVFLIPMLIAPNNPTDQELTFGSGKPLFIKEIELTSKGKSEMVKVVVFKKSPAGYTYTHNELLLHFPTTITKAGIKLIDELTLDIDGSTYQLQKTTKFTELNIK